MFHYLPGQRFFRSKSHCKSLITKPSKICLWKLGHIVVLCTILWVKDISTTSTLFPREQPTSVPIPSASTTWSQTWWRSSTIMCTDWDLTGSDTEAVEVMAIMTTDSCTNPGSLVQLKHNDDSLNWQTLCITIYWQSVFADFTSSAKINTFRNASEPELIQFGFC